MIEFDWDEHNIEHLARHNVTRKEAEECFLNGPYDIAVQDADTERRFLEVGATPDGRILLMTTTLRREAVRFVTAFDAPRQWRIYYHRRRAEENGTATRVT